MEQKFLNDFKGMNPLFSNNLDSVMRLIKKYQALSEFIKEQNKNLTDSVNEQNQQNFQNLMEQLQSKSIPIGEEISLLSEQTIKLFKQYNTSFHQVFKK